MPENTDLQALLNQALTGTSSGALPTVADIDPLNMDSDDLRDAINQVGSGPKMPQRNSEAPQGSDNPYTDLMQAEMANFKVTSSQKAFNPLAAGKQELFGAGADNHFYQRYYEHPSFDKLGFSPFRDNETFYNENSTWFDDLGRTFGEWGSLIGIGASDSAGFGDFVDANRAKSFEEHMAIGSSTRGGGTEFFNNLFLNSGYTFGILGELALEELGLALVTGASMGTASGATAPLAISRATRAFMNIKKGLKATQTISKSLKNLKDVNKARTFYQGLKSAGKSGLNFINPASSLTSFGTNYKKLDNISGLGKTTLGFASFYRDVRNVRLAYGESALEGGMVQNQLSKDLLSEFKAKNGRSPNEQEALEMKETAIAAGHSATWQNIPTIFFSNKIVFDNMFKGFSPIKRLTDDVIDFGAKGKLAFNRRAVKDGYSELKKGWKGLVQTAKNPKSYFRTGRNYFKANFAEGLQEIAQETISGATMEYYKNRGSKADILTGGYLSTLGNNLEHMVSVEGLEIFGSGFLMGGMVQGPQKLLTGAWDSRGRLTKAGRENHLKAKDEREKHLTKTINILNEFYNDSRNFLAPDLENMMEQFELAGALTEAAAAGDEKAFRDLQTNSDFSHAMTALQMGRFDSMVEQLEGDLKLSDEEILAIPGVKSVEAFKGSITKAVSRAREIEKRYDKMQKKYPNPVNPAQYTDPLERMEAIKAYSAWQSAQKDAIFLGHSFDRTLERMSSILETAKESSDLDNIPVSAFNKLFNFEDIQIELQQLTTNMKLMDTEEGTLSKETKKLRKEQEKSYELLSAYEEAMAEYVSVGVDTVEAPGSEMTPEAKDKFNAAADAFENYIKHLGSKHKQPIFEDNLAETFQKIVDYFQLEDDSKRLTSAVNTLMNPKAFKEQVSRIAEINEYNAKNKKARIRQTLETYENAKLDNEVMNELYNAGMFFDPEEWLALKEDGQMPSIFYDIANLSEIEMGTPQYTKALEIVKKYMDITGKEIPEAKSETTFNTKTRRKKVNDRRTYKELAEQFGFDPEAESSEVSSAKVFEAIINSPYSTKREKTLAKEYLKHAKPEHTVRFVKNQTTPGQYLYGEKGGTLSIDPRYSSREYRLGSTPIEFVILHEETHRLTVEALANDEAYNNQITELREKAMKFHASAEPDTSTAQVPYSEKLYYGLSSNAEFVAEAMSNPVFQKFLGGIAHKHTPKNKTIWDSFVTSVVKMLKTVFGKKQTSGTLINAAIDIITGQIGSVEAPMTQLEYNDAKAKIETQRDVELQALETEAQAATLKGDLSTTIGQLKFEERIQALIDAGIIDQALATKAGGRPALIINIGGVKVPFYRSSSGTEGKIKGKWYPFFGFDAGPGWLIKGHVDQSLAGYDIPAIQEMMELLNNTLNWDHSLDLTNKISAHPFLKAVKPISLEQFNKIVYGAEDLDVTKTKGAPAFIAEKLTLIQAAVPAELQEVSTGGTMTQTTPYETPTGEVIQLPGTEEREWEGAPIAGEEWVSATGKEYTITAVDENEVEALVDGKTKPISKRQWLNSLDNKKLWPDPMEFGEVSVEEEVEVSQEDIDKVNVKYDKKLAALDKRYEESKAKEEAAKEGVQAQVFEITRQTAIEKMPEVLVERLVEAFIQRNESMAILKEDPILTNFENMTPLEISKSKEFRTWVADKAYTKPGKILDAYVGKTKEGAKRLKTEKMRRDLVALGGYTREDTNVMSFEEILNSIELGLSKEAAEALYKEKDEKVEANVKELITEAKTQIVEIISAAENMDEFEAAKKAANALFAKHVILMDDSFTGEWLNEVLLDKQKQFAFSVTAAKIKTGMTVQLKNGGLMKVVNANPKNKTILLENSKTNKEFRVYRDKVQEKIEFVWSKAMDNPEIAKEMISEKLSPEGSAISEESMKENKKIKDTELADTDAGIKAGKKSDDAVTEADQKAKDAIKKNCK